VLGEQPAEVLMDMLERASGHEPATHDDMLALGTRLDGSTRGLTRWTGV
jgi:hypothetical protein